MSSRRKFITDSVLGGAAVAFSGSLMSMPAKSYRKIIGSNDRLNVAIAGLGRRLGAFYTPIALKSANVELVYLCDVMKKQRERALNNFSEHIDYKPKLEVDIRKVIDDENVDVLLNLTPDHWHTPGSILAMKGGKHVYVEKPCSHNMDENELLVAAAKKYDKVVQMGNQQRSSDHTIEAIKKIHDGMIGKAYMGKGWYSNSRKSIGIGKEAPVPSYLDWELWQGPAPRRVYKDNLHPYNWHWFWHWGTGETLNNATHEVDLCRWALQEDGYPNKITSSGGRFHFEDDWEFYDTLVTSFEYDDKMITWEGKSCNEMLYYNRGRGVTIHGTEGTVLIDRNSYEIYDIEGKKTFEFVKPTKDETTGLEGGGSLTDAHFENFIAAITKGEKLNSSIETTNPSANMLLISNIAWKYGKILEINNETGHILNHDEAMKNSWGREYEQGWKPKV